MINRITKNSISTVLFVFLTFIGFAQQYTQWTVPDDKKNITNPVKVTPQSVKTGEELYIKHCKVCHGNPGMGDVIKLTPPPKDPASDVYQVNTDGELFYKISAGRSPMPSFASVIPDAEKWNLINYLRKFKVQQSEEISKLKDFKLAVNLIDSSKTLIASLTAVNEKNETVPVQGVEVGFFVKRYFGQLNLAKEKIRTNSTGMAKLDFPKDLPGDTAGNVNLTVKLVNERFFGKIEQNQLIKWGIPVNPKNILDGGHMWGNRLHAPWWIVSMYLGVVIGVWGFIFYIGFLVFKIWKAGKASKTA